MLTALIKVHDSRIQPTNRKNRSTDKTLSSRFGKVKSLLSYHLTLSFRKIAIENLTIRE